MKCWRCIFHILRKSKKIVNNSHIILKDPQFIKTLFVYSVKLVFIHVHTHTQSILTFSMLELVALQISSLKVTVGLPNRPHCEIKISLIMQGIYLPELIRKIVNRNKRAFIKTHLFWIPYISFNINVTFLPNF